MSLFDSKFYDFNIHPDGSSITELAFEAKRLGYSGIAVINSTIPEKEALPENFSIYRGIELSGRPSRLREEIKKHKGSDILTVTGGDESLNRAAVETEGLDILIQPAQFNNVLAKTAADNSIALGFNPGFIIHFRGEARVRELLLMKKNLKHARKYNLSMILTSSAHSIYDLRSPRELAALGGLFGMTKEEAVEAMSAAPCAILRRKSPEYIQEGIEIV
ncbi:MAG: ribonuclease P protein component 3 [Euryarchaeota archaeon]|nr:ribonuclease P protein component 3 [Euryarchaeota archaeon]MBU4492610.1 ribonuclease P protein component 3 [Euryarchaeota archaeon]MCG2728284.1 ribonuclease P protein component 3 [Candidatus Methanoperedenaceae archaeon]